jgi:hypothetical protein
MVGVSVALKAEVSGGEMELLSEGGLVHRLGHALAIVSVVGLVGKLGNQLGQCLGEQWVQAMVPRRGLRWGVHWV